MNAKLFSRDVQEFLRSLAKHDVRYVLIGGTAVIYHGYARLTGNVDVFYDSAADNVTRLWAALLEFWGGAVPVVGDASELANPDLIVQFGRPPNRIDLIAGLKAVPFGDAWRTRIRETIDVDGSPVTVWVLGLQELRRAKRDAGRPKDLDDLQHLPER